MCEEPKQNDQVSLPEDSPPKPHPVVEDREPPRLLEPSSESRGINEWREEFGDYPQDYESRINVAKIRLEKFKSDAEGGTLVLRPMNSYLRRIIHAAAEKVGLSTSSQGEEPNRFVVVTRIEGKKSALPLLHEQMQSNQIRIQVATGLEQGETYLREMLSVVKESNQSPMIGFDIEWGDGKVSSQQAQIHTALIQISTQNEVLLLRLDSNGKYGMSSLPDELTLLLDSDFWIKCGVGLIDDLNKLNRQFRTTASGFLDLQPLARQHLSQVDLIRGTSLLSLLETTCGLTMEVEEKERGGSRTSNWEAETLSQKQVCYAAADAYAAVKILSSLFQSAKTKGAVREDMLLKEFVSGELCCDDRGNHMTVPAPPIITVKLSSSHEVILAILPNLEETQWVTQYQVCDLPSRTTFEPKANHSLKKKSTEAELFLMPVGKNIGWEARAGNIIGWSSVATISTVSRPGDLRGRRRPKQAIMYKRRISPDEADRTGALGRYEKKGSTATSHTPTHFNLLGSFTSFRAVVPRKGAENWETELTRMTQGLYMDMAHLVAEKIPHFTNETTDRETEVCA